MNDATIKVSIIIVNFNTKQLTANCIDSIIDKTTGLNYEIILVDNNSTDGSKELFENDHRIKYIYNEENKGFGIANNIGFEKARGEYIFFLNSDTILINNAIKILSDTLDADTMIGVVGGNLYNRDNQLILSHSKFYLSVAFVIDELLLRIPSRIIMRDRDNNKSSKIVKVAYVSGADLMIRSELFEKFKFDPNFFLYCEEVDLCLQVHRAGFDIVSNPQSKIIHLVGSSSKKESTINERKLMIQQESAYYYMHKNHSIKYRFFFYLINKLVAGSRVLEFTIVGNKELANFWKVVYKNSKVANYK